MTDADEHEAVGDLICDLLHLADVLFPDEGSISFLARGLNYYLCELDAAPDDEFAAGPLDPDPAKVQAAFDALTAWFGPPIHNFRIVVIGGDE